MQFWLLIAEILREERLVSNRNLCTERFHFHSIFTSHNYSQKIITLFPSNGNQSCWCIFAKKILINMRLSPFEMMVFSKKNSKIYEPQNASRFPIPAKHFLYCHKIRLFNCWRLSNCDIQSVMNHLVYFKLNPYE